MSPSLPVKAADDPCADESGAHQALQQQPSKACSEAEASSTLTAQQDAAAASTEMLLSSYSAQAPAQPRDLAGAEAADLPACGAPQQSGKAKPEHAALMAIAGDMPMRRCV